LQSLLQLKNYRMRVKEKRKKLKIKMEHVRKFQAHVHDIP